MDPKTVTLSLISHTNIGKTTLSRTLLRRDIGEVRDAPHVTDESTYHTLWQHGEEQLILWDTPGFGSVLPILKRVRREGGALGWIMNEVVDRLVNRSLYSSYEATKNVRAKADVVLYLVNAREAPQDAGYVNGELELLDALNKPVVMVVNQAEPGTSGKALEDAWKTVYAGHACLKDVILLDAFTRSHQQELRLVDVVLPLLDAEKQVTLKHLRSHYVREQKARLDSCAAAAAEVLWFAGHQKMTQDGEENQSEIMAGLLGDLQGKLDTYIKVLIDEHQLRAEGQGRFKADVALLSGLSADQLNEIQTGLLTGALAGASSGLVADIMAGGLTLGGGAILGFLGGYLGGFSSARVLNWFRKGGRVAWKSDALTALLRLLVHYYLLAALHGRGRGALDMNWEPAFLSQKIDEVWPDYSEALSHVIERVNGKRTEEGAWSKDFSHLFGDLTEKILDNFFE